jgi:site-specific recombinase XerD
MSPPPIIASLPQSAFPDNRRKYRTCSIFSRFLQGSQIPLVDEAVKALRNYKRYRNSELILDDDVFFLAKNGTSLNVSTVKYLVAKYVKQAGIRKKVGVHTLRHTFGAHKADKHISLATLQELMGHKKKETTLKYIHLAKTNLRQEMVQTAL